jgi:hypothetical protein
MWMIYTVTGLGIALALVALYLFELHPYSERIPARCYFSPGPGQAHAQGTEPDHGLLADR